MKKNQGKASATAVGDFLFEIGCEELPAGMIAKASGELKAILEKYFSTNGLIDASNRIEAFGGPRRLTAIAHGVRLRQEDVVREVMGPPKSVAYDNLGEPTRAAMSFAEKQGIPVSKLAIVNTAKGRVRFRDSIDRRPRRVESSRRSTTSSDSGDQLAAVDVLDRRARSSIYPARPLDRGNPRREGGAVFIRWRECG